MPNRPADPAADLADRQHPEGYCEADELPPDWRERTLRRLEAWIEEEERLIAEIERRVSEAETAAGRRLERSTT